MTQPRNLHELYQLLWEQIKDAKIMLVTTFIWRLRDNLILSNDEADMLAEHYVSKIPQGLCTSKDRKAFVLQMIEETKNN